MERMTMTRKVLIVDDNNANLYMLESLLKGYGFEVTLAENGRDALDKARLNHPDLVVTDILMPVMDGYALCREWKSDNTLKHIPLVFYTATYTELKDEEFAISLGADRFIIKPQEPEIFMNIIKEVLEGKYTARQALAKPLGEEMEFFRRYNEILFKKLEKKMSDLEIANQKLRVSEECYRLSFINASDVIYTMDSNLILLSISPSVERILGYKPQDFIGRPVSDFGYILTPESYEQAVADINLVLTGETNTETIYQFIAKDGTIKYGEVSRAPLLREGTIIGVISVARDITERKQAEEKLRQGERMYRELYDFLPIPVYEMDLEGNITAANRAAYKFFGGTAEDLKKGFKAWQILSPEDVAKSKMNIQMLLKGEHVTRTEYTLRRLDGTAFPSIIISSVIFDNDKPVGLRGAIIDITERRQQEEKLQFRNILLSTQQEASIDGILVVDEKAQILLYNSRFVEMWGIPANLVEGGDDEPVLQFVTAQMADPTSFFRQVQYLYENRHETSRDELILADGRVFDRYSAPMFGPDDRYFGRVWYFRDITERKWAEGALRESEEKYRSLVEYMHDTILLTKPDGSILDANKAACEMFGRSLEEIKNVGRSGLVDETDPHLHAALKERERMGTASAEITMLRANGEKFPVEITSTIFTDASGQQKTSMIIRDITERKRAEEKVRESEKRLSTIIDFLPDATFAIDRNGKVLAWNRAMEKMTGMNDEDILGKGNYEYSLPFYGKRIPILIDLVFDYDETNVKKYHFIRKEGDVLLAEGRVPVRGEEREL
jgi:two-component system sensor histidine kinase/response regulator